MTENSEANQKAQLRGQVREARAQREPNAKEASRISEQLGQFCIDNKISVAAAYFPIQGEPDIREFLTWALHQGVQVFLPSVSGNNLHWRSFDGNTAFGELGFEEATGKAAKLSDAQVIFLPAMAVDLAGNRLGKGKGYYDRALEQFAGQKRRPKLVAVVFDEEVLLSVPHEAHDLPVDAAITAAKLIWFKR